MNKKTLQEILAYLPGLQDHADKFAYQGEPADAFYDEYDAEDEHGNHLVISQECNEMCETIGADLQNGESWEDLVQPAEQAAGKSAERFQTRRYG